jgi:hypothetical protein
MKKKCIFYTVKNDRLFCRVIANVVEKDQIEKKSNRSRNFLSTNLKRE